MKDYMNDANELVDKLSKLQRNYILNDSMDELICDLKWELLN